MPVALHFSGCGLVTLAVYPVDMWQCLWFLPGCVAVTLGGFGTGCGGGLVSSPSLGMLLFLLCCANAAVTFL